MEKSRNKIEIAAYLCVIFMTAITITSYIYRAVAARNTAIEMAKVAPGTIVPTLGEDWPKGKRTVVIALSTHCGFCNSSAPFYKDLVSRFESNPNVRLIAVLPEGLDESHQHLTELGIAINDIKSLTLSEINVAGTPTILLIDENRRVADSWVGKLDSKSEAKVINAINSSD